MQKKSWWIGALVVVILLALGGGWYHFSHPATIAKTPVQAPRYVEKRHVKLVALGDSLTHGQGDETKRGGYVDIIKHKIEHHYRKTTVTTVNYGGEW